MQPKTWIWIGVFIGSTVGGLIPSLWGAGLFSFSSTLFGGIGSFVGIWLGWKISQNL